MVLQLISVSLSYSELAFPTLLSVLCLSVFRVSLFSPSAPLPGHGAVLSQEDGKLRFAEEGFGVTCVVLLRLSIL